MPDEFIEDSGHSDEYPKRDPLNVQFTPEGEKVIEDMQDEATRESAPQGGSLGVPQSTSPKSRDSEKERESSAVDASSARDRGEPTNDPSAVSLPPSSPGELATPISYSHLDVQLPSPTTGSRTTPATPLSSGDVTVRTAATPPPVLPRTPPTPPIRPKRSNPRFPVKRSQPTSGSCSGESLEDGKSPPRYNLRKREKISYR